MALNTTPSNRCLHPSVAYSTNHNPATTSAFCQGSKQTYLLHNAEHCQSNSYSRLIKFLQAVVEHGTNQIIISCAGWCPLILLSFSWNSQVVPRFCMAWEELFSTSVGEELLCLQGANWFFPHGYSSTCNLFHTRVSLSAHPPSFGLFGGCKKPNTCSRKDHNCSFCI